MTGTIDQTEDSGAVVAAARDWVVRLAGKDLTAEELDRFKAWLGAAPEHRAAFEAERRFWHRLEGLRAVSGPQTWAESTWAESTWGEPAWGGGTAARKRRASIRRSAMALAGALAACLALFLVAGDIQVALLADHETAVGAQQKVALPDGSTAFLNTDSAIRVRYGAQERRIELLKGEAFFEVVADKARPFRVVAEGGVTQAVGTAFVVRATGPETAVAVAQGRVDVRSPDAKGDAAATVRLHRGEATRYAPGSRPLGAQPARPADLAPWRNGTIRIDDLPLDQALAELDRYQPGRILLLTDGARLRSVSGAFDVGRIDAAITALAATQNLTVTKVTDYLVILR